MVGIQTAPLSTSIEEQELGGQEVSETSSSFPGGEKAQEILKDDKNALLNLKEEVSLYTKFKYVLFYFFFG